MLQHNNVPDKGKTSNYTSYVTATVCFHSQQADNTSLQGAANEQSALQSQQQATQVYFIVLAMGSSACLINTCQLLSKNDNEHGDCCNM